MNYWWSTNGLHWKNSRWGRISLIVSSMKTNAVTVVIWHNFNGSQQSCRRIKVCSDLYVFLDLSFTCKLDMAVFYQYSNFIKLLIAYLNIMISECCCFWPRQYLQNSSVRWFTVRCWNRFYAAGWILINPILVKEKRQQCIVSAINFKVGIYICVCVSVFNQNPEQIP